MFFLYNQDTYFWNFNRYIWRSYTYVFEMCCYRTLDIVIYILLLITKYVYKR